MNEQQQQEIAEGLRVGNPEAWRLLFDEYAPQIWQYVAARMEGRAASGVADVVQETMLAAAKSAGTYEAELGSLSNWLRGIAQRQIALSFRTAARQNILQRSENELRQSGGRLANWLNDKSDLPEDVLSREETSELVRGALGRLPQDYGDLLTAKYLDELTVEQIATARGTTVAGVQSMLARARRAFRDLFAQNNPGQES